jgi:hypothetical protein
VAAPLATGLIHSNVIAPAIANWPGCPSIT